MLTQLQRALLKRIVESGDEGCRFSRGANTQACRRLHTRGLVYIRGIPWTGANGVKYMDDRWFVTKEGRAALGNEEQSAREQR